MEKIITYENLRSFAYVNDNVCAEPIRGIIVQFFGLNGNAMYQLDTLEGEFYGEKGILFVIPYTNPWSWMNRQAVGCTDEILDVLFEKYALDPSVPVASTGGSMGGQSALVYSRYAKRTPAVCVANCPVCDMEYHFGERPDLPRTIYSALWQEEGSLTDALHSVSPLHLIGKLPRIGYHILHCDEDKAVDLKRHSEVFTGEMKKAGYDITLDVIHGRGHCDLGYGGKKKYAGYILSGLGCDQG